VYCTGNTLDDDRDFYGREALLASLIDGPRRAFVVGLRRTGKTAILLKLERDALAGDRYVPLRVAPEGVQTAEQLARGFANALSRRRRMLPSLPGGYPKLKKLPLDELLGLAEDAALEVGRDLLLLLDELDVVARLIERDPELGELLRCSLPETGRVVAMGSRRAMRLLHRPLPSGEPLLSGFAQSTLPPFLEEGPAWSLVRLEQREGSGAANLDDEQVRWLLDRTGGHPYLTQAACKVALRFQRGPDHALRTVLASHEAQNAFAQDLERVTPGERRALQAVLEGREVEDVAYHRTLVDLGLLTPDNRLTVPVLADFVALKGWDAFPCRLEDAEVVANPQSQPGPSFRAVRLLGSGTFGDVVLMEARSARGVRRMVAVKLLKPYWAPREKVVERLRDEARMLALLRHRCIVRAEDLVRVQGRLGVLMEYVPGADLKDLMSEPLPSSVVASVIAEVAEALDVAYNRVPEGASGPIRVLHRDIKPHNIRITEDGEVKILDFGVAGARVEGLESRGSGGGTPGYMGPERHAGSHEDPASDLFSLGVLALEAATAERPPRWPAEALAFEAMLRPRLDRVAEPLRGLLQQMTAFDPRHRSNAGAVSRAARVLAAGLDGPDLRRWARERVPPLMERPRNAEAGDAAAVLATFPGFLDDIQAALAHKA
jgi:hypothetical protein